MYLPQFHTFKENDDWWGKGYTEWEAVKNAKSLYDGHEEPRVPLNNRYYDLSKDGVETLKWQAELAKKYGIYGFSIYQYYFCGKTLMEKPLETLRNHKEIDLRYHICWANESFSRTWYGLSKEILMKQEYGCEADWNKHFDYLLTFFQDERYIKIDHKPVLQIYKTFDIPCLDKMLSCFQKRAKEAGFDGIYVISGKSVAGEETRKDLVDGYYYFEPSYTLKNDYIKNGVFRYYLPTFFRKIRNAFLGKKRGYTIERKISAEFILSKIENRDYKENEFPGLFASWDNTPRRNYKGLVYLGTSPKRFEHALCHLKEKKEGHKTDFIYINAWNEWGEGAYIEPDTTNEYQYLEAVKRVVE